MRSGILSSRFQSGYFAHPLKRNRLIATSPGALTSSDGLFQDAKLRAIPQLFHDPLSQLEFGEGRQRNLLYVVDPSDASTGGTAVTAVISLMESGDVELRLMRGAPRAEGTTANETQLFGVFHLHRVPGTCF